MMVDERMGCASIAEEVVDHHLRQIATHYAAQLQACRRFYSRNHHPSLLFVLNQNSGMNSCTCEAAVVGHVRKVWITSEHKCVH